MGRADFRQDIENFPAVVPENLPKHLFRIFFSRNHLTGDLNSAWNFSSQPPGRNRFDVRVPWGTCYWSDRRYGAWVEVFRGLLVVDVKDVTRRRLFIGVPPPLHLADTASMEAYAFGVTAELATTPDYDEPQRWAETFLRANYQGLRSKCRHDPSHTAGNIAIFGEAGAPQSVADWTVQRVDLREDPTLASELSRLGVTIAAVPHVVPVVPPSSL